VGRPSWAGGESTWGNATIFDVDARSHAFRGLANDDNGTCLIGGSIHGNPPYGATHASPDNVGGESGRKRARHASPLQKFKNAIIFDVR